MQTPLFSKDNSGISYFLKSIKKVQKRLDIYYNAFVIIPFGRLPWISGTWIATSPSTSLRVLAMTVEVWEAVPYNACHSEEPAKGRRRGNLKGKVGQIRKNSPFGLFQFVKKVCFLDNLTFNIVGGGH